MRTRALKSLTRRGFLGIVAGVTTLAVSGTAFAFWTTSGTGSGSASNSTLTFQVTALVGSDESAAHTGQATTLIPNGSANAILRVTNPNSQTVHVTAITGGTPSATGGCPVSNIHFANPSTFTAPQFTITAHASVLLTLTSAVSLDVAAPQSCMGATFSFPVTVTVQT
jgi:hypothetical protein